MADKELEAQAKALAGKPRAVLGNMLYQGGLGSNRAAVNLALQWLDEAEKKEQQEREDRHYQDMREQNERHHKDLLRQGRIFALIAVVAAGAAAFSAWYARVQVLSIGRPPEVLSRPKLEQSRPTESPVLSAAASGSATDLTTQAPQPTTNQTAQTPR
jgi:cytoskeletal protein RodZ